MKKLLFISYFFVCALVSNAQPNLFGMTIQGGRNGGGVILNFRPETNALTGLKNFDAPEYVPQSALIQARNGILYGTTTSGGTSDAGVIFSYNPSSSTYTILKNFVGGADGSFPIGSLVEASDGRLFGVTVFGGTNGYGVIFAFTPSSSTYTVLKNFDGSTDGGSPSCGLFQASNGNIFGITNGLVYNSGGVIFSFNPSNPEATYSVLKNLDYNIDGSGARGSLVQGNDGNLYGMTGFGGPGSGGVIFSFNPLNPGSTYSILKNLDGGPEGGFPSGSFVKANDGILYGTTWGGGTSNFGVLFSFNPTNAVYTKLFDFDGINGGLPQGNLLLARDGNLYGTTNFGGSGFSFDPFDTRFGVIFSYNPSSSTFTIIKNFDGGLEGGVPANGLVQASNGKLYGATYAGGGGGRGVFFSFELPGSIYSVLRNFGINPSGNFPQGKLVKAFDGKLYGTTSQGGTKGRGVIFSFDPSNSKYSVVNNFDGVAGAYPPGNLVQAIDGKLYGITSQGGSNGTGVIFSYNISSSSYTALKSFEPGTDGANPSGSLVQASDGKLYGVTTSGGIYGGGVIFSYDPNNSAYSVLKSFIPTFDPNIVSEGFNPLGSLIQASNGKLYGMTALGGANNAGVIFSYDLSNPSSPYEVIKSFDFSSTGFLPIGSLFQASDGKLYCMTLLNGNGNAGVLFSFDPLNPGTSDILKSFDGGSDGGNPIGILEQASDGKLYGMTGSGGSNGKGVIFSWSISPPSFSKLKDFIGTNGLNPGQEGGFIDLACKPVISCPPDKTVFVTPGSCGSIVDPGLATAIGKCGLITVTATRDDGKGLNDTYSVGITKITWKAKDGAGNISTCQQKIKVKDNQPPVINTVATPIVLLWPANHNYQTINLSQCVVSVTDNCSSIPVSNVNITKVTSDEPENIPGNSDGDTKNDIKIAGNCKSVDLRRERQDGGNGRVYTIYFSVTDSQGNKAEATCKVVAPANINGTTAVDNGSVYTVNGDCRNDAINSFSVVKDLMKPAIENEISPKLTAMVMPNPAKGAFNLVVNSSSNGMVDIRVLDITGREVQRLVRLSAGIIQVGHKLIQGTYIIEIKQGKEKVVLKAVKQ